MRLTFPDGSKRSYQKGLTGSELAAGISKIAGQEGGGHRRWTAGWPTLPIRSRPTPSVKIITRTDPEALELIRHDAAHVMAEAVQSLWPGTQVTIGPVIENGFFYDFAKEEPFHPDDLAKIEAKMHEIITRDAPFTKEFWSRDKAKAFFRNKGELFKVELVDAIPAGEDIKIYKQGEWLDLCRGPHMTSTGQIGRRLQAHPFRRAPTGAANAQANGCSASTAPPGRAMQELAAYLKPRSRRPRSATTVSSGARWICSISRRRGRAWCSGIRKAGSCSRASSITSAGGRTRSAIAR